MRPHSSTSPVSVSSPRPVMKRLASSDCAHEKNHTLVHPVTSPLPDEKVERQLGRLVTRDNIHRIINCTTPSPCHYQPQSPADDGARRLIWHYFQFVCSINSCSDSPLDSMRTVLRGLMSSSRLIYFCVLSMSAAHLHRVHPGWSGESLVYFTRAISTLRLQLNDVLEKASASTSVEQDLDQALVGIILLGMSTSWHNASELGLEHIVGSRILLQKYVCPRLYDGSSPDRRKLSFFVGLQTYWETVASFLLDQDLDQLSYLHEACIELSADTIYVHPWTGISSTAWILLAKAGCIARKRLHLLTEWSGSGRANVSSQMDELMEQATILEAQLLGYELPLASSISNSCTEHASIPDLYRIARCCKYAALLEVYKAFGSIWDTKPALDTLTEEWNTWKDALDLPEFQGSFVYTDIYEFLSLGILRILQCISAKSSTKCLQPFLLLIAGSTLCENSTEASCDVLSTLGEDMRDVNIEAVGHTPTPAFSPWSSQLLQLKSTPTSAWRQFVHQRITTLEQWTQLDSLRRIRLILLEAWACNDGVRRMDPDCADDSMTQHVHWINVMEEKQLQFMF